ncbi:hypothetical protein PLUTE_a1804 [Pseudoalteromonas luteoviolacea DSM 6061]|nr:hypothetical protein [Pseudoalteromonas luteoviolacea DSM 6061]
MKKNARYLMSNGEAGSNQSIPINFQCNKPKSINKPSSEAGMGSA